MNILQQMAAQAASVQKDMVKAMGLMPAFPKPHLFKRDGLWYCTRHVYQDELLTMWGLSPSHAFERSVLLGPVVSQAEMRSVLGAEAMGWLDACDC